MKSAGYRLNCPGLDEEAEPSERRVLVNVIIPIGIRDAHIPHYDPQDIIEEIPGIVGNLNCAGTEPSILIHCPRSAL